MGTLSQLFSGTTPPVAPTYNQTTSSTPAWLQNSSNSMVAQANAVAGQPYQQYPGMQVAPWTPDQYMAQSQIEGLQGAYNPYLQSAGTLAMMGANNPSFGAAQSYLPQASGLINNAMAPSQASMNPYINNVTNQAAQQAQQYWQNFLQPSINNQFTAAGQFGSSANQRAQGVNAAQINQNIQNTAQANLANAYTSAQQAGLAGAGQLGTLAQLQGGLGYEQGILGLQGAGTLANIGTTGNQMALQNAGTLYNIGQAQQQQGQNNLNTAYQNWYNQTYYPENQLSWLSGIINGQASNTGMNYQTANSGYLPGSQYGASPLYQAMNTYNTMNTAGNLMSGTGSPQGVI